MIKLRRIVISVSLLFGVLPGVVMAANLNNQLNDLQTKIKDKQSAYDELQNQINVYKQNVQSKQQEELTLTSQMELIDQDISLNQAEADQTETEIETLGLQIQQLQIKINSTEDGITTKDQQVSNTLVDLYNYDQQSYLEIALAHNTLSDFSEQVEYTGKLNTQLSNALTDLKDLKSQLKLQKNDLTDKQKQAEDNKKELEIRQVNLQNEKNYKDTLLSEVQNDESKFQELVRQVQQEQQAVDAQITDLQRSARQTLNQLNEKTGGTTNANTTTIDLPNQFNPDWPLPAPHVITTYFHDPNYIYRRYFEHNALDIDANQGDTLRAADSGVVQLVRFDGSPSTFAYVLIAHADNYQTLYGHVSDVYVEPGQVVQKGQAIAAVGGTPGTPGAGVYTSGSHVHFEVLLNGIPVDPLPFMP